MKGTSYIIMWLTMFLVLILAMVLGLVLLLLAEFYCSPLSHRHRHRRLQLTTTTTTTTDGNNSSPPLDDGQTTHPDPLTDVEKQFPEPQSPENQNPSAAGTQNEYSLVYISNPIYGDGNGTPFETPESSPSRLETEDSSSGDDEVSSKVVVTPPLTPMKKLPAEACSVCLKDVGSLGTSESDTNSNTNNGISSSCSLTPCTSPSM